MCVFDSEMDIGPAPTYRGATFAPSQSPLTVTGYPVISGTKLSCNADGTQVFSDSGRSNYESGVCVQLQYHVDSYITGKFVDP